MIAVFIAKYGQKILAGIAIIVLLFCIRWAWSTYVAEPYRDQGRAEVQAKWDKREKELAIEHAANVKAAVAVERSRAEAKEVSAQKRLKDTEHEKAELQASLDSERNTVKRMRTITGKVVTSTDRVSGIPETKPGSDAVCEARLPAEIGDAFQSLREGALRIGSEANELAIKMQESQRVHAINQSVGIENGKAR